MILVLWTHSTSIEVGISRLYCLEPGLEDCGSSLDIVVHFSRYEARSFSFVLAS